MSNRAWLLVAVVGYIAYKRYKMKKIADAQLDILGVGDTALDVGDES